MREQIYYIYRHIRLDTNEVFYIGRGKANMKTKRFNSFYYRAFSKSPKSHNIWWHRVVEKTSYNVEIILQSNNEKIIEEKERELIKLYGRRDLGLGTLVNLTDGNGSFNLIYDDKRRAKMSENSGMRGKFGGAHHGSRPVFAYTIDGKFFKKFNSRIEASRELNVHQHLVVAVALGQNKFTGDWIFYNDYKGDEVCPPMRNPPGSKTVECFDKNGNLFKEFKSAREAARYFGSPYGTIFSALQRKTKHKGYILQFKTLD